MDELKTRKFWFLVLNISICISFSCFTIVNQFSAPSKIYSENFAEKSVEGDEKANESSNHFYLQEMAFEWPLFTYEPAHKKLADLAFMLPMFSPSPNTPPPDLS